MHTSSWEMLGNLLLAALLGAVGQLIRVVAGLKKASDDANAKDQTLRDTFDGKRLLVSLGLSIAIGSLAGLLAAFQAATPWDKSILLSFIGAGYAGSDFIEAFMQRASKSLPAPPDPDAKKPLPPPQNALQPPPQVPAVPAAGV